MNGRPNKTNSLQRYGHHPANYRRPFWLPASNYYILAAAVTIGVFFLLWGVFHDDYEETPWVGAGIGASIILAAAVFLREVILRKARLKYLSAQKQLDYNLSSVKTAYTGINNPHKLTLEKNASIIGEIKRKSSAAKVLNKLSNGHYEVFEICNEYLSLNKSELKTVSVGSPRIAALRRGREVVKELHRFHLLEWASIEARALTQEASLNSSIDEKLDASQKALKIVHTALQFYPNEIQLKSSEDALNEFIATIKVSHWIEQAERSAFKGHYKRAVNYYRDALFYLNKNDRNSEGQRLAAEKITAEIEKIHILENSKKVKKQISKNSSVEETYD